MFLSFLISLTIILKSSLFALKLTSFVAFFDIKLDRLARRDAFNN
jgi:hypothetical protein